MLGELHVGAAHSEGRFSARSNLGVRVVPGEGGVLEATVVHTDHVCGWTVHLLDPTRESLAVPFHDRHVASL